MSDDEVRVEPKYVEEWDFAGDGSIAMKVEKHKSWWFKFWCKVFFGSKFKDLTNGQ